MLRNQLLQVLGTSEHRDLHVVFQSELCVCHAPPPVLRNQRVASPCLSPRRRAKAAAIRETTTRFSPRQPESERPGWPSTLGPAKLGRQVSVPQNQGVFLGILVVIAPDSLDTEPQSFVQPTRRFVR